MSVATPSQLRQFLQEHHTAPRKTLSQNFLIDQNIIKKIIVAAGIQENDFVLEIGPGAGALTEALVGARAKVVAVEKDSVLAKALTRLPILVYEEDFMDFSLNKIQEGTKIVANLPYHLTTPILTRILNQYPKITQVTVMVQKEVADRMKAEPGSKEYGALSIFCQFFADVSSTFLVKNSCFYPRPKIDSCVITFKLRKGRIQLDEEKFFRFTRQLFSMRRKMIKVSLKQLYQKDLTDVLTAQGINPCLRIETLSLNEMIILFQCVDDKDSFK